MTILEVISYGALGGLAGANITAIYRVFKNIHRNVKKYSCSCGGVYQSTNQMYLTHPPQQKRQCDKCGACKGFYETQRQT